MRCKRVPGQEFRLRLPATSGYVSFVSGVTSILDGVQEGDPKASEELLPMVYEEWRKFAAHKMAIRRILVEKARRKHRLRHGVFPC